MSDHDGIPVGSDYSNFRHFAQHGGPEGPEETKPSKGPSGTGLRVKRSRVIWYLCLAGSQLTIASLIASLVFVGQDAARYGPVAGHVIWLVLSAAFAISFSGCTILLHLQNRRREREKKRQMVEMTSNLSRLTHQNLRDHTESAKRINALVRTARRSMHSLQESERDVQELRDLNRQLSERGSRHGSTFGGDPALEDGEDEQAAQRRRLQKGQGVRIAEDSLVEDEQSRLNAAQTAELRAFQTSLNRSRENVSKWLERQNRLSDTEVEASLERSGFVDTTIPGPSNYQGSGKGDAPKSSSRNARRPGLQTSKTF